MKNIIFYLCFTSIFFSCDYDVAEELYPPIEVCDTIDLSYSMDIVPIIDANCYRCHDAQNNLGNVTIDNYDDFKAYAVIGRIISVISHEDGWPAMPEDAPKIDQCLIDKIDQWIKDGAKNN